MVDELKGIGAQGSSVQTEPDSVPSRPTEAEQAGADLTKQYQRLAQNTPENEHEIQMLKDLPREEQTPSKFKRFWRGVLGGIQGFLHPIKIDIEHKTAEASAQTD